MPSFGKQSETNLKTAVIDLQLIFREVVKYYDCTILAGFKDEETQNRNFENKVSKLKWPDGRHNSFPSHAVDVSPYPIPKDWGKLTNKMTAQERDSAWKERAKFYEFAAIVKFAADQKDIKIRWGGDWDGDHDYNDQTFDDLVHFETVDK